MKFSCSYIDMLIKNPYFIYFIYLFIELSLFWNINSLKV